MVSPLGYPVVLDILKLVVTLQPPTWSGVPSADHLSMPRGKVDIRRGNAGDRP